MSFLAFARLLGGQFGDLNLKRIRRLETPNTSLLYAKLAPSPIVGRYVPLKKDGIIGIPLAGRPSKPTGEFSLGGGRGTSAITSLVELLWVYAQHKPSLRYRHGGDRSLAVGRSDLHLS